MNPTTFDDTGLIGSGTTAVAQESKRRRYDEAFRREALRIWRTSGRSAESVAKELDISVQTLYYWAKDRRTGPDDTILGPDDLGALRNENERLRGEVERLKRQKQILRRALGIMAENLKNPYETAMVT